MVLKNGADVAPLRPARSAKTVGGCHAHSRSPRTLKRPAAARGRLQWVFHLTKSSPLPDLQGTRRVQDEVGTPRTSRVLAFARRPSKTSSIPPRPANFRAKLRCLSHAEVGQAGGDLRADGRRAASGAAKPRRASWPDRLDKGTRHLFSLASTMPANSATSHGRHWSHRQTVRSFARSSRGAALLGLENPRQAHSTDSATTTSLTESGAGDPDSLQSGKPLAS